MRKTVHQNVTKALGKGYL